MTKVNRSKRAAQTSRRAPPKQHNSKSNAEALQVLKSSGVLNPNVTLDQIMRLAEQLNIDVERSGAFIFREFIYRPC